MPQHVVRHLGELRRLDYVDVRDRRYLPGLRLARLVHTAGQHPLLGASVRRTLQALSAASGETAVWVIEGPGEDDVIAMARVESPHQSRFVADIGKPWPMKTTAAGRVFMAFRHPPADRSFPLGVELARVRGAGFAVLREGQVTAVAAPIPSGDGSGPLGVLSVVGPRERLPDPELQVWPLLRDQLRALGARGPRAGSHG